MSNLRLPVHLISFERLSVLFHEADEVVEEKLSPQLFAARVVAAVVDAVERISTHLHVFANKIL